MAQKLKATFFAFRTEGRRGGIGLALVAHVAVCALVWSGFFALYWAEISTLGVGSPGINGRQFWLMAAPFLLVHALVLASYEAVCLSWMIHGAARLSFPATLRVYLGHLVWFLIIAPTTLALSVGQVLAQTAFFRDVTIDGLSRTFLYLAPMAFPALFGFVWISFLATIGLRLAPGNAVSVASGRFAYFHAWSVTRQRWLALLGSYAVICVICFVVYWVAALGSSLIIYSVSNGEGATFNTFMTLNLFSSVFVAGLVFTFLSAGVNARATLVAIDEGKLKGVTSTLVNAFD